MKARASAPPETDNPGSAVYGHYDKAGGTTPPASAYNFRAEINCRVRVRSVYGIHNRGCRIKVSGCCELVVLDFSAADAAVSLALAGPNLVAFTSALVNFLSPEQRQSLARELTP